MQFYFSRYIKLKTIKYCAGKRSLTAKQTEKMLSVPKKNLKTLKYTVYDYL